jgi:hypothetical protein
MDNLALQMATAHPYDTEVYALGQIRIGDRRTPARSYESK